ncbi:MAG TPA: chemotaxis protein CheW [Burkholderiaceae bacterium]|nr:chemotaxis protein CheW [Burkholderiaceae bacterium]
MSDRKKNLREFQSRLSERLRLAASGTGASARLGVQVGEHRLLVELAEAGEVAPLPAAMATVPMARDWFRGLVNLRGALFAVSDLARFAGGAYTPASREARLIAFAPRLGINGAIVVARMLGLKNVGEMQAVQPEADGRRRPGWLGTDWLDADGHRWTELSLARLAADDRFLAVGL